MRASLLILVFCACAPDHQIDGRPYALAVPRDAAGPLPLIILLHGFETNAAAEETVVLPFSRDVDRRKFLFAQPNGTTDREGKRFWNATDACCDYGHLRVDDVAFLRALIADVKTNQSVDPRKVFVIGHSNGGFMALRLACDASDVVTAVVSLAGAGFSDPARCASGQPVSVLAIHGNADDTVLYEGGSTETGVYPSAHRTVAQLAARNGCTGTLAADGTADFVGDAELETTREATEGCPTTGRADLWTVDRTGHIPFFNDAFRTAVLDWLEF